MIGELRNEVANWCETEGIRLAELARKRRRT
jgi:hypothetical protein